MDRKQSFKKAKNLINKASALYGLRDYNLNDGIDFPLGMSMAKLYKGKKMDVLNNWAIGGVCAKRDRELNLDLKIKVQECDDEDIQQISNSIMRIFVVSITKKAQEIASGEKSNMKQSKINVIGRANNACVYLLEVASKEIVSRELKNKDSQILKGLSTRMLSYLTVVVKRRLILLDMDGLMERCKQETVSDYEQGLLDFGNTYYELLTRIVNVLKDRGVTNIEQQIKDCNKDVEEYVHNGYVSLFK